MNQGQSIKAAIEVKPNNASGVPKGEQAGPEQSASFSEPSGQLLQSHRHSSLETSKTSDPLRNEILLGTPLTGCYARTAAVIASIAVVG